MADVRLINAVAYCKELKEEMNYPGRSEEFMTAIDVAIADLADMPIVDAVAVVRCKNCKHCCLDLSGRENHLCMRKEVGFVVKRKADDFCSYGERRNNGKT